MSEVTEPKAKVPTAEERMANREADRAADEYQRRFGW